MNPHEHHLLAYRTLEILGQLLHDTSNTKRQYPNFWCTGPILTHGKTDGHTWSRWDRAARSYRYDNAMRVSSVATEAKKGNLLLLPPEVTPPGPKL